MKTSIQVQNLKCGGCANTIVSKLIEIENISDIEIAVEDSKIAFSYKNETEALTVKKKLKALGYPSIEENNSFTTKAKSYVSCATGKFSK